MRPAKCDVEGKARDQGPIEIRLLHVRDGQGGCLPRTHRRGCARAMAGLPNPTQPPRRPCARRPPH